MLISAELLAKYTKTHKETDLITTELITIYIGAAQEIISNYLGYDPEVRYSSEKKEPLTENSMYLIKKVCLEIATLIQLEENNNIGVNTKTFGDSGSRTYLNTVDYSKYLVQLSAYREVVNG